MFDEIFIKEMSSIDAYNYGRQMMEKELNKLGECEYNKGRADTIDKVIKSLEAQFLMQNNPNSKFVETIVLHRDFIDALEQLKENSTEEECFKNFLIALSKNSTAKLTLETESGKNIVFKEKEIEHVTEQLKERISNER